MNNDLISREALLKVLCEGCNGAKKKGCGNPCCDYELIELAPAVDAEPVVRCKDCKHRGDAYGCPMYFVLWHGDDIDRTEDEGFCADGERKEK